MGVLYCADDRTDSRSSPDMLEQHVGALIDASHSVEVIALLENSEQLQATRIDQNAFPFGAKQEPQNYQDRI